MSEGAENEDSDSTAIDGSSDEMAEDELSCTETEDDLNQGFVLRTDPHVHHGIFMVGTMPLNSVEAEQRHALFLQQTYLIRGVNVDGLDIPGECLAEAKACGLITSGQATWDQLQRLLEMLPSDRSLRWPQERQGLDPPPKRFTTGAWVRGPMTGVNVFARAFPWTARLYSGLISTWDGALKFSTVTVSVNVTAKPHRDSFNHAQSRNLILPFS